MFDTPAQIQQAARIQAQAVASQIMPLGNITQMTQQERDLIGTWINQGARAIRSPGAGHLPCPILALRAL
jgi:uncharacterized membrane protein